MSLISLILVLLVVGVALWLINSFIPMDSRIKMLLNVVVVIFLLLWMLQAFGLLSGVPLRLS